MTLNLKPSNVMLAGSYRWVVWLALLQHSDLKSIICDALPDPLASGIVAFTPWRQKNDCQAGKAKKAWGSTSRSRHIRELLPMRTIRGDAERIPQFSINGGSTNMQLSIYIRTTDRTKRARIACLLLD